MDRPTTPTCPVSPNKYVIVGKIGEGSFGEVFKVFRQEHNTIKYFALKKPRYGIFTRLFDVDNYGEIQAMKMLKDEENFLKIIDLINYCDRIGVVMELCRADLRSIICYKDIKYDIHHIKNMLKQYFTGLAAMHNRRIMHRDLKPENVLISDQGVIKIGDLGSAVKMDGQTYFCANVGTLWYKSPENIFGSPRYDEKVDVWSSGIISAEFFTRETGLFKGLDRTDQMKKISEVCGFCSEDIWSVAKEFPLYKEFHERFANYKANILETYLEKIINCPSATEFIVQQLQLVPDRRITAENALKHKFLTSGDKPAVDLEYILQQLN